MLGHSLRRGPVAVALSDRSVIVVDQVISPFDLRQIASRLDRGRLRIEVAALLAHPLDLVDPMTLSAKGVDGTLNDSLPNCPLVRSQVPAIHRALPTQPRRPSTRYSDSPAASRASAGSEKKRM